MSGRHYKLLAMGRHIKHTLPLKESDVVESWPVHESEVGWLSGKSLFAKSDEHESNPQDSHGRREPTHTTCPETSICTLYHACAHMRTQAHTQK